MCVPSLLFSLWTLTFTPCFRGRVFFVFTTHFSTPTKISTSPKVTQVYKNIPALSRSVGNLMSTGKYNEFNEFKDAFA